MIKSRIASSLCAGAIQLSFVFVASCLFQQAGQCDDKTATNNPDAAAASVERLAGTLFGTNKREAHSETKPTSDRTAAASTMSSRTSTASQLRLEPSGELRVADELPTDISKEMLAPSESSPRQTTVTPIAREVESTASEKMIEQQTIEDKFQKARIAANAGNFKEARRLWEILTQLGHADSQYALGRMYAKGDGVKRDFFEAKRYFELAAQQNHARALHSLGIMARNGDGQVKNQERALAFFQRARAAGYKPADQSINDLFQ